MSKKRTSRRSFLRTLGIGTAAAVAAPHVWKKRVGHAAPLNSSVTLSGGAIVFVLNGGARSQCVFNGSVAGGTNPFGQITGLTVPISQVQQGTDLVNPVFNASVNLVSTVQHHNRTGNHSTGRVVACTGYEPNEDKPGILALLNQAFAFRNIPCVNIGNDTPATATGSEISSTFSPIKISSARNVTDITDAIQSVAVSENEQARLDAMRFGISDRFLRSTRYQAPADIPFFQRKSAEIAAQLNDAALDVTSGATMGTYVGGGGVTNAGLRTTFGTNSLGESCLLAVRLRQLGVAGIGLSTNSWDMHSNEQNNLPGRANDVGRAIGGLINHLSRIPDPLQAGLTLLDTTVITVMSDFGRGNWAVGSGFNGNNGSDHRSNEDKTAFQCIPIIGGGLPGGKLIGEIGGDGSPVGASPTFTTRQVLATVLDLLGLPPSAYFPGAASMIPDLVA